MSGIDIMKERRSIRKFDPDHTMPEEDLQEIIEAAIEAPSSWNLQHWKFLAIQSDEKKQEVLPIAYNQKQVADGDVTIAVLGDREANHNAEAVFQAAVDAGDMTEEIRDKVVASIHGAYDNEGFGHNEALINASLASMQLMLAAKEKGYDSVPMGGFDGAKLREACNIPERYEPVMLIAIGKATGDARQSFRFSWEDAVIRDSF
ncbi:nitroreductase [Salsuginibacillus halophilus]|uniref:Nitroreductase n=1 Tax=Salsuginibacillus halophilus TaxID=517424 RepID=A0A2P8H897_9BACI|nr:nitroreductase family protein [Salsuginibacillus halophilus]PSL42442.1 nitroreductase [Salsuginibacillus halophilus]